MGSEPIWTPELLLRYAAIGDVDISDDGAWLAYTVREPVLTDEESRFVHHLYRVSADGQGEPQRLTFGRARNDTPRWSPGGHHLAFLSDRDGGIKNLYVMRADGGEAWPLTKSEKGVRAFAWSPDGTRLAYTMVPADDEERKRRKKAKDDAIRWDVEHERARLWVVEPGAGSQEPPESRPLTDPDRHVVGLGWDDDGRRLVYTYQPTPVDDDWPKTRLAVVAADGSPEWARDLARVATYQPTPYCHAGVAACGTTIGEPRWTMEERVVLYPLDGSAPRPLAVTPEARAGVVGWAEDGGAVYAIEWRGVSSVLLALPVDGGAPLSLLEGQGVVTAARSARTGRLALVVQDVSEPNAVAVLDAGASDWRIVARPLAAGWPRGREPRTEGLRWRADDGLEIEGLLTYPLGYRAGQAYPTLVVVHGGPAGVYSRTYLCATSLYPLAAFAERGYVLLRPNPRGSSGYGHGFRAANRGDWGGGDYGDIMRGVDLLVERGIADPDRLGIMGWSYGGFMTSWAITQTRRFGAASVGAGVTDLVSFNGTSDISGFVPDYFGGEFWEAPEVYLRHSPVFRASGVKTPTLIQHGDSDVRVPVGQGRELYNALKRQGVTVEMDIYPRQGHGPDEPRLLQDLMERNLAWFDRWLGAGLG